MAVIAAVLVFAFSSLALAAPRRVLFEQGTEWGCVPCYQASATVHAIRTDFGNSLVSIKWHCWWPAGNDPWYWHNNTPQQTRIQYYGVNGIPDIMIDGSGAGNSTPPDPFSYTQMANSINARLAVSSPIGILNGTGVVQGNSMNISFDLNVETPQVGNNFRLFVVATEEDIRTTTRTARPTTTTSSAGSTPIPARSSTSAWPGCSTSAAPLPLDPSYNILGLYAVLRPELHHPRSAPGR
jgi:hypothetical protein